MRKIILTFAYIAATLIAATVPSHAHPTVSLLEKARLFSMGDIYEKMTTRFARGSCLRSTY